MAWSYFKTCITSSVVALSLAACANGGTGQSAATAVATGGVAMQPTQAAVAAPTTQATTVSAAPTTQATTTGAAPTTQATAAAEPESDAAIAIALKPFATGFTAPLYVTHAGDNSGRVFVVEKRGTIAIVRDNQRVETPFLDITNVVGSSSSEQGLLSVAFHPKYASNGLLFVDYTDKNGDTIIARYKVSSNPDVADPQSAKVLLKIDQPAANHNGGLVKFGPDGYLYIGMGDGGRGGDPWGNAQNTNVLLGKLLRLDVDSGDPYGIPPTNPFANGQGGKPEVWAYGLRNPWRYSFDRADGTLFMADVGQDAYEEIDVSPATQAGLNYGWNTTEALHCYNATNCTSDAFVKPVSEYPHSQGCSVTGGYVYRGAAYPQLAGTYFFGDYCSGRIWSLERTQAGAWQQHELLKTNMQISSFGEDQAGEMYVTSIGEGTVYQLTAE